MEIPIARSIDSRRSGTCVPTPPAARPFHARSPGPSHGAVSPAPHAPADPVGLVWVAPSPDPCPLCHRAPRPHRAQSPIDLPATGSAHATEDRSHTSVAPSISSSPPIDPTTLAPPPPSRPPLLAFSPSPPRFLTSRIASAQTPPDTKRATRQTPHSAC